MLEMNAFLSLLEKDEYKQNFGGGTKSRLGFQFKITLGKNMNEGVGFQMYDKDYNFFNGDEDKFDAMVDAYL